MERTTPGEKPRIDTPEPEITKSDRYGAINIRLGKLGAMDVLIDPNDPTHADIEFVNVDPEHRNMGIGRKLHEIFFEQAISKGIRKVSMAVISSHELRLIASATPVDAVLKAYEDETKQKERTDSLDEICEYIDEQQALLNFYDLHNIPHPPQFHPGIFVEITLGSQEPTD